MVRVALTCLCLAGTGAVALAAVEDEFIRVGEDHFSFVTRTTRTPFVPFGTNFVFNEKRYLNLFGPEVYDRDRYERALEALEQLGMNIVKVFLPIADVLPDPQVPGEVRIAPGYLDNLDDFLRLARKHHIRAVVTLCCWGGNGIKWWHEGGEYFGRKPWKTDDGIDSLDVLARFWTALGTRFRDNPTIFSYTPAVEWSFPAGNLTWTPPDKQGGRLETEQGLFYWRAFLRARYGGDVGKLNEQYKTAYKDFAEVTIVDFEYNTQTKQYADPDAKIIDYQNFREWASNRYFASQIAALRRADPNHLVTISNHPRLPIGLWEGAARHFMGTSVPEQADLVDYIAIHDNRSESDLRPGQTLEDVVHNTILTVRFCNAGPAAGAVKLMPVILEECTFAAADPEKVADGQERMVLGTIGHASGWMNWYLQYPHDANEADMPAKERSAILNDDFTPTPWGRRVPGVMQKLKAADLSRRPAATVIEVDRNKELVARAWGPMLNICHDWGKYQHPVDFRWPRNEWLNLPVR